MTNKIKFALQFPQGLIFFMEGYQSFNNPLGLGAAYFQPHDSKHAFGVRGDSKELFGKHAITVKDRETGDYSVVHEFSESGALADARLVTKNETLRGTLADETTVQALQAAIDTGKVVLHGAEDPCLGKIFNAASFPDGRILVQLEDRELYIGTPGNYQKLETTGGYNGGGGTWRDTVQGDKIALPYGLFGPMEGDDPMFNDQKLTYIDHEREPAKINFKAPDSVPHINPFSPQATRKGPSL